MGSLRFTAGKRKSCTVACTKDSHVSRFLDLDLDFEYRWHLSPPREQLNVALATLRGEERVFDASFSLKRRELTRGNMLRTLARFPWMTARVVRAIYWQAFRLWRKKCPFYPHPKHRQRAEAQQP